MYSSSSRSVGMGIIISNSGAKQDGFTRIVLFSMSGTSLSHIGQYPAIPLEGMFIWCPHLGQWTMPSSSTLTLNIPCLFTAISMPLYSTAWFIGTKSFVPDSQYGHLIELTFHIFWVNHKISPPNAFAHGAGANKRKARCLTFALMTRWFQNLADIFKITYEPRLIWIKCYKDWVATIVFLIQFHCPNIVL